MRRFRHLLSSRKAQILAVLAFLTGGALAADALGWLPRGLPKAGILVVDLRHGLPDMAHRTADGRRSVSAVTVLRALDAARDDRRIVGTYLRVGGHGLTLAQASEIADAVLRLRRAGKFAVAYSDGFTAANLSDRVLASVADEIWSPAQASGNPEVSAAEAAKQSASLLNRKLDPEQKALWKNLVDTAQARLTAAATEDEETGTSSVHAVLARADRLAASQHYRGPEAQAEQAARKWGGADADFVSLPAYRDTLDRGGTGTPVVALIQAEGVMDGPDREASRPTAMAAQIRAAAGDGRVTGIVIRISAVAASDDTLDAMFRAAREARRDGTPVGISFGPFIPGTALQPDSGLPMAAAPGSLLVDLAPGPRADALEDLLRSPWRQEGLAGAANELLPAEAVFLREGAVAVVTAGKPPGFGAGDDGPAAEGMNRMGRRPAEKTSGQGRSGRVAWKNDVGSLLDMRDRLVRADDGAPASVPRLVPYGEQPSVWSRTKARFVNLKRRMADMLGGISGRTE